MSDDDFEVEYLEEDEDIVQNCLETLQEPAELVIKPPKIFGNARVVSPSSLLVERACLQSGKDEKAGRASKRSYPRRTHDDDSDYQPVNEDEDSDYEPDERPRRPKRQRKPVQKFTVEKPHSVFIRVSSMAGEPQKAVSKSNYSPKPLVKTIHRPQVVSKPAQQTRNVKNTTIQQDNRKKPAPPGTIIRKLLPGIKPNMTITYSPNLRKFLTSSPASSPKSFDSKVPGKESKVLPHSFKLFVNDMYLCDYADPKRFDGKVLSDYQKRQKWNDLCRKRAEYYKREKATSASVTQCLRKVSLKVDGKFEDVVRIRVETRLDGKPENFQAILPRFETPDIEVKFDPGAKRRQGEKHKSTMILTKEVQKDGQFLVAFSSTDFRSTTYKLVEDGEIKGNAVKKYLKMMMSCKMCASCYQYSWRGNKDQKVAGDMRCSTCSASFTSAYNLLSHVRSHRLSQLDRYKQNKILSKIMKYHYACRLCSYRASSIQDLRRHLQLHRGVQKFKCEVGQHFTY